MSTVDHYLAPALKHFTAKRYREVADVAGRGLKQFPDDGHLWQLYGLAKARSNDLHAARQALEKASALIPLNELAQAALANCYLRMGQPESARAMYLFLAERAVSDLSVLPGVAAGLGKLEEYGPALHVCQRIVAADPTHHQAHFGIAYYMIRLGAPLPEVIEPLSLAMDLAPQVLIYRLNLACVFAQLGRFDLSYSLIETLSPGSVRCPYWLRRIMEIYERFGDYSRFLECQQHLSTLTAPDQLE